MSPHDRENLKFLMSISPEGLLDWYNTVSEDDKNYASELLRMASHEMERKALVAAANLCLAIDDEKIDCTQAKFEIAKFTLKGRK